MNRWWWLLAGMSLWMAVVQAQSEFPYKIAVKPLAIEGMPGVHSYAVGTYQGKWLILGGRLDGIHARQPFNAFPASQRNDRIWVVDPAAGKVWSQSLAALPLPLRDHWQSSNINFRQVGDVLYLVGGYGYSDQYADHRTFSVLSAIDLPGMVEAVERGGHLQDHVAYVSDPAFAVTGGQLGYLNGELYLVGGHQFDGRYNPHGPDHGPGFRQEYTNQVRRFEVQKSGDQLTYVLKEPIADPVHLHRRDYNLLPMIDENGERGLLISSGVFQLQADLPYLYPVEISKNGVKAITDFSQYLSHYHCAKANLYDPQSRQMHTLFFGGLSQFYYDGTMLMQDDQVPFVRTISRLTRKPDGSYEEHTLEGEMPGFRGTSAEFLPKYGLAVEDDIIALEAFEQDSILLGHVVGGISSSARNPFQTNQTELTEADAWLYEIYLVKEASAGTVRLNGSNPFDMEVYPNPAEKELFLRFHLKNVVDVHAMITDASGTLWHQQALKGLHPGLNEVRIALPDSLPATPIFVTGIFHNTYYVTKSVVRK